jgi:uncharacterized SAM-binding protein YcdF (DUF218 family)
MPARDILVSPQSSDRALTVLAVIIGLFLVGILYVIVRLVLGGPLAFWQRRGSSSKRRR